jgi:hypothetical protein
MREDIQKNFILLSKVAKEKKYAQEYLGLLARRGDIGSIRIGKRWYTTWAWFEEFLENSQKKKNESVCEIKVAETVKVELEKVPAIVCEKEEVEISMPFVFPEKEKVFVAQPVMEIKREEKIAEAPTKIAVAVITKKAAMPVRKNVRVGFGDIRAIGASGEMRKARTQTEIVPVGKFAPAKKMQPILRDEPSLRNISVAEKNRHAVPYQEIMFKKKAGVFSPDLSGEEKMFAPMFSRFAFAAVFATIVALVAASGYFVWSGGLLAKGTVAGAHDERNAGFSGIISGGEHTLESAGDKMKESLSISRVMVAAAKERGN